MVNKNYKVLVGGLCLALASGCGSDEQGYKPKPVYSGTKPTLPGVPTLPNAKRKDGDAYTVYGASHDLRSQVHKFSFRDQPTSIVGWIVRTNYEAAPDCAIHEMGEADPPGCEAPTPGFWIADSKDDTKNAIGVMGWAANFAQIYTMIEKIDKEDDEAEVLNTWGGNVSLPNPLPEVGGRVKVTGRYGVIYRPPSGPVGSDPKFGIIDGSKIEWLEKPPKRAVLRGMKIKNE